MVKYFKELDNLNDFKVYIMQDNSYKIDNREITLSFYKKYYKIFEYIRNFNNLFELKLLNSTFFMENNQKRYLRQIEIIKLIEKNYLAKNQLYDYLIGDEYKKILDLLNRIDNINSNELIKLFSFYNNLFDIINPFNDKSALKLIKMALNELNNNELYKIFKNNTITLPNYWYILPSFHELNERLYNTTGENGHKEANLVYPYYDALNGKLINPNIFIDKVKDIEKNGVSLYDYISYVRYGFGTFPNLLNDNSNTFEVKSHIKNNIIAVSGSVMAQGLLWNYFWNLNQKVDNYKEALGKFQNIVLDDFLVRFVGFHKIILINEERIISTSNLNYQEEFTDYKNNGWQIDFTKPLYYNYKKNQIEEIDDDIVKLKQFHIK